MMKAMHNDTSGALQGIRVLDLSRFIAGPYCPMVLGDMVADVAKVEKPGSGDPARGYQPQIQGRSTYSLMFNRNTKGVALDLRAPEGQATLRALRAEEVPCGKVTMQGVTIKLSDTPLTIRQPMPEVGQHTVEVLREWLEPDSSAALVATEAL